MAKDKERSVNPAQQQRKLEKAKALKKSKTELQHRRNEKLAKRNPQRIQSQIDDLKALEVSGDIKPREKAILADLERDLKAVNKAREALGDKAAPPSARPAARPPRPRDQNQGVLGKRRRGSDSARHQDSGSDTDESVRNIPWPRDTPPPVPKEFRRSNNAATAPFGNRSYPLPAKPEEARTTYESAPQIRDLKKEAVNRFVPNVVKRKQDAIKGAGGQLLEPEELDRLERQGYGMQQEPQPEASSNTDAAEPPADDNETRRLREEEDRFEREMAMQDANDSQNENGSNIVLQDRLAPSHRPPRQVEVEEVEDEDG